jgi:hypothetical protein
MKALRRWVLVGLAVTSPATLTSAAVAGEGSNAISDWQVVMESAIPGVAARKNVVALPYWGYVTVAMFDAVNSIDRGYKPFAVKMKAPVGASQDAAAASAAHDVLVHYFPAQTADLDSALANSLAKIADGQSKTDGVNVGRAVAAQWLAMRTGDGLEAPLTYTPGHGPGIWEPVPTVPASPPTTPPPVGVWMTEFKPLAMKSADQFLREIPPPPALRSQLWARNFNRTKDYGAQNSTVRTPAETEIGLFWTDEAASQYSRALRGLISNQNLDTADSARLTAMFYVAASDAGTACMNAKYHFAFWRPYTAIHDADTDGNPDTVADPNWVPLAPTPGHPEYPANHGCVTQAAMDAIEQFFGTDEVPFSVDSKVTNTTHVFESLDDVVKEVDNARVYGGMHYRHSTREGNRLGNMVTSYIFKHYFQRHGDGNE